MTRTVEDLDYRLRRCTYQLRQTDLTLKNVEAEKQKLRTEFFNLANEYITSHQPLAKKIIVLAAATDIAAYIEQEYPTWHLIEQQFDNNEWVVTLQEKPEYQKFSFINPELGLVFSRQIAEVGSKFDLDSFQEQHPEMAEECIETVMVQRLDEKKAQELVERNPDLLSIFQDYTLPGRPQARLGAIRKATEDDL